MDIATVVLSLSGIAGGGGTILYWLETRTGSSRKRRSAETKAVVKEIVEPLKEDLTTLKTKVESDGGHISTVIKAALYEALDPLKADIGILKGDTSAMWRSLEQLSVALAEQMHKPHPENAELDSLLEKYVNWVQGDGTFSTEQELKLRSYLKIIKTWKPGQHVGFIVDTGDPTRAATLLATMDLTRIRHNRERQ